MAPVFAKHKQNPPLAHILLLWPLLSSPRPQQTCLLSPVCLQSLFILLPGIQLMGVSSPSDPSTLVKMSTHHGLAAYNSPLFVPTLPDHAPHLSQLLEPSPSSTLSSLVWMSPSWCFSHFTIHLFHSPRLVHERFLDFSILVCLLIYSLPMLTPNCFFQTHVLQTIYIPMSLKFLFPTLASPINSRPIHTIA